MGIIIYFICFQHVLGKYPPSGSPGSIGIFPGISLLPTWMPLLYQGPLNFPLILPFNLDSPARDLS